MKRIKFIALLALALLLVNDTMAQRGRRGGFSVQYGQRNSIINNFDLNIGWYNPDLGALEQFSSISDLNLTFDGGIMASAQVDFRLFEDGFLGVSAGYWSDQVEGTANIGGIDRTESLTLSMIPLRAHFIYEFHLGDPFLHTYSAAVMSLFHPYIGFGTQYLPVTQQFERQATGNENLSTELSGSSQTFLVIAGLKHTIGKNLDVGFEYNYVIGGFDQQFESATPPIQTVDLDGHVFSFKISYTLKERIDRRYARFIRRFR
jgi:hypothetical protein